MITIRFNLNFDLVVKHVHDVIKHWEENHENIFCQLGIFPSEAKTWTDEIADKIDALKKFENVIVKFGRFIPDAKHRFDDVLGVELASDNQFAERIS